MSALRIKIACPARPGSRHGNRVTALRWQRLLRELGHHVRVEDPPRGRFDVLVALHAKRSAAAVRDFKSRAPDGPVVVAITGTDLYRDGNDAVTQTTLNLADRIVVLQDAALNELTSPQRRKARVIYQSALPLRARPASVPRRLNVCVAGHLRALKDPFRAAYAVRGLPSTSRIWVNHYGGVMESRMRALAEAEMQRNARYTWHGEVTRSVLRGKLARSWLLVLSSKMEGGANVLSEAIVNHVPVLASRIPGSVGLLGSDYDGFFPVSDTGALKRLMLRCEREHGFHAKLQRQVGRQAKRFTPARERSAWKTLLAELPHP